MTPPPSDASGGVVEYIVTVTVSGKSGCGKSAILGEIENVLRAKGIFVSYADPSEAQKEKGLTDEEWFWKLEHYHPRVVLVEVITP